MRIVLAAAAAAAFTLAADKPLVEGNPDSRVRVLIFEDLQCSDCAVFRTMLDKQLLPKFGAAVAFEHRDFPLAKHAWARDAAIASRYFAGIGRELAVEWRRYAMSHQGEITAENFRERLREWSRANGGDGDKAAAALKDPALAAAVDAELNDGIARGIARTPTVLVDGEPFIETFTFEEIARAIEGALRAQ